MEIRACFDKKSIDHIRRMRDQYFHLGAAKDMSVIRKEILACWEIYNTLKTSTPKDSKECVTEKELQIALDNSKELISIALPYMELLQGFLQSDDFWISLMDSAGIIIKIVGAPEIVEFARSTGFYEGAYRGKGSYPGLFYICRTWETPYQIVATEHPDTIDDDLAGSVAPILDIETGEFLGAIGISGYWWNSHNHTLGLAIMVSDAIAKQLALQARSRDIITINQNLDMALESVDIGLIYFSEDGKICAINQNAINMISNNVISKEKFLETSLFDYFDEKGEISQLNITSIKKAIDSEGIYSLNIIPSQKRIPLHCSIRKRAHYLMQLQKQTDINKIVTDIAFPKARFTFNDIIGNSAALESAKSTAMIAALYSPTVLITGESGTGKELFAQAIHNSSPRANGPFIAVNCGAIPRALIESELFGYESGAFTGAKKGGQQGKFELANHGTIFLDEIGDMPYETQVAILRVLQTKEVVRVGGNKVIRVDIMIIAATNQNLIARIKDRSFREDVYYRLNVFSLHLPALRERKQDIQDLAYYFCNKYSKSFNKKVDSFSNIVISTLNQYPWPGNIRELENAIERAVIVCNSNQIQLEDLPECISKTTITENPTENELPEQKHPKRTNSLEREQLVEALKKCNGNLTRVAHMMGISRPTLYQRLKRYGMYPPQKQYGN